MTDKRLLIVLGVLISAILVIALGTFLFTKDCETCITGLTALKLQGGDFWVWAIGLTALSSFILYRIIKAVKKSGGYGISISVLIPIIVFISIAFGRACTDKANNGTTSAKGNPNIEISK